MKKILLIALCFTAFMSCKNDSKSENVQESETKDDELVTVNGDFVYFADAAVLQTPSEIYGVVIDEKMHELNAQIKPFKIEDTDMVPVIVKGRVFKKDSLEEGWENKIEIKEILKVSKPNPEENEVIKLGNQ